MNTTLIYILFAFSGPSWIDSVEVMNTKDYGRCEAVKEQLEQVPDNGKTYRCMTLVAAVKSD